ncbi:MAG: glycosyltransferase family 2 protein [Verrucomicrobia bacterium]|nr:glycosyltransferase family 2 protein [Verrucomicrobiota bacterium]
MRWILFFLFATTYLYSHSKPPIEFVIVTPSYNNELWCEGNLQSIISQTYPHWSLIYINDCSTDATCALVDQFIHNHKIGKKCRLIHNTKRVGAMANFYRAIGSIEGHKVVVHLDGDDRFAHDQVLERLARVYEDEEVWMTYGNYVMEPNPNNSPSICAAFPEEIMRERKFRSYPWVSSALRTYYATLFHKIKKDDFLHEGKFFSVASDLAFMFPLLEMASLGHIHFIEEVLYIYNRQTPINDDCVRLQEQMQMDTFIRQKERYQALQGPLFKRKKPSVKVAA